MSALSTSKKRLGILVRGVVQGVGFRPFVYKTATALALGGSVKNSGNGVEIEIEGEAENVEKFLEVLRSNHPPLAKIESIEHHELPLGNEREFGIIDSFANTPSTLISPDVSLCERCRDELFDPESRFYHYPFINCTDCGPRYTIIHKLPYDRKNTSMRSFAMCKRCKTEYEDIHSRRYHAQPIACKECGPSLYLYDGAGVPVKTPTPLEDTVSAIKEGKIVAIKGLGGFHLVCDATSEDAVSRLRRRKKRASKPLAVMFASLEEIQKHTAATKRELELIASQQRPIVIVTKNSDVSLAPSIAPDIDKIGVFLPYTPLHELLLQALQTPIVATSANISDAPICIDQGEVFATLQGVVDLVLSHDREIVNGCDDSVMQVVYGQETFLRLSRGFAPKSFFYQNRKTAKKILAVGARQKSTIALGFANNIILSPHIGDLGSIESMEYFNRTLETFFRLYDFEPDLIVCDKHPGYESTVWAQEYVKEHPNVELVPVQHHYAHALSVMAEYELSEDLLAFCFDGTGYGDDGTLWGGEVLVCNAHEYKRVYSFEPTKLLGGESAIKEPKKIALSMLFDLFSLEEIEQMENTLTRSFTPQELRTLHKIHQKGLNAPTSSSLGRIFDAVYALSGYLEPVGYEGQSGMIIEKLAKNAQTDAGFRYTVDGGVIRYKEAMVRGMLTSNKQEGSAKVFLNTLRDIMIDIVQKYDGLPVVLCGGVFQNATLLGSILERFEALGIRCYVQRQSSINDGSIALGQAYWAFERKER